MVDILEQFRVLIEEKEPKAVEPSTGAPLSLAERLKAKMQKLKVVGGVSDFNFADNVHYFEKRIRESSVVPFKHHQKLLGADGVEYDVVCKVEKFRCEIVSDLFPQPFFVVNEEDYQGTLHGKMYTVREFLSILKLAMKFNGTIKFQ